MPPKRPRREPLPPPPPEEVSIEYKGKTCSGWFTVRDRMVHLTSPHGSKATHQGGLPAAAVARMLLQELVGDYERPASRKTPRLYAATALAA